jgi:hypothetical protein
VSVLTVQQHPHAARRDRVIVQVLRIVVDRISWEKSNADC